MKTRRHLIHGLQGKAVQPRFERQFFRTIVIAESSGDDFVHDLGGRESVFENLLVGAAEIEFAVHETFEPGKIGIHIGADVISGNGGQQNRCHGLLKWHAGFARFPLPSPPAPPFMAGAEQFLMPADLLDEIVKGSLDGRSRAGSFLLDGQLSRWQAQIQGDKRSLARRILIDDRFQMDQFGPEDLKALLDFEGRVKSDLLLRLFPYFFRAYLILP